MYISRLNLDNFGPFNGDLIAPIPPGLTVVLGPNEAGKSALRAFIRVILFGFPTRAQSAWNDYYYAPHLGGEASGSLHLSMANGSSYSIHRSEGSKGGPVAVAGDMDGGGESLTRLLAGIDADLYQNVFSVGLTELQSFESLNRDEIRDRIYSAGMGLVNVSLPFVTKELDDRIGVFRKTRSGQLFDLEKKYSEANARLEDKRSELAGYEQLAGELAQLSGQLADLDSRIEDIRRLRNHNARVITLRPHWIRAGELQTRLDAVPERPGFPERGSERLEELLAEQGHLHEQISEGDVSDEMQRAEISALPVVEAFIEHEAKIARVVQQIGYYAEAARDIPGKTAEEREAARDIERARDELGPNWSEQRLREFKDASGAAARLQESGETESLAKRSYETAVTDIDRAKAALNEATQAATHGENRLGSLTDVPSESGEALATRRDQLDRLQAALAEFGDLERFATGAGRHTTDVRPSTGRSLAVASALGLVGLGAAGWGLVAGELSGVLSGMITVGVAITLGYRSVTRQSDGDVSDVKIDAPGQRMNRVSHEIESLAHELGMTTPVPMRGVVEALSAIDRAVERRAEYERRVAELKELDNVVVTASNGVRMSEESSIVAADAHKEAVDQWNETLSSLALHTNLDMPRALTAVGNISTRQAELRLLDETRRRIAGMTQRNGQTDRALAEILNAASLPGFEPGDGLHALRDLEGRWNKHRDALAHRRNIEHASQSWNTERKALETRATTSGASLDELIGAAGFETVEEFRSAAAALSDKKQILNELRQLNIAQPELIGPDAPEIAKELDLMSPDALEAQAAGLEDQLTGLDIERVDGLQRSGELKLRLQQLEAEEGISQLHATIDRLTEETRIAGRNWSVLTVARTLLDRTRDEFQESRQPALLGLASEHFRRMTLGRYSNVRAVLGENRFEVVMDDSIGKRPEQLSRGTAEQLFLALRFALVEEYCRNTESMPVLLDDVLVNFDPVRARAAAAAVIELSKRHQVIALTCHPDTVTMFQSAAKEAGIESPNVVDLAPGALNITGEADATGGEATSPKSTSELLETPRPRMQPLL